MDDGITVINVGTTIATTGTSASATIPTPIGAQSGSYPFWIRVSATAGAYVKLGKVAATATTSDIFVQPADAVILRVPSGYTKIAAIQDSGAGKVNVVPLEDA